MLSWRSPALFCLDTGILPPPSPPPPRCRSPAPQLHAAVVELYCDKDAEIKYSTVQNWYAGDANGRGGIYNFVTKRGLCAGPHSKISWTQVGVGGPEHGTGCPCRGLTRGVLRGSGTRLAVACERKKHGRFSALHQECWRQLRIGQRALPHPPKEMAPLRPLVRP